MMDEPVSKSQKKREADYLQKIGIKLIELSSAKLDELPLTEQLYKAIIKSLIFFINDFFSVSLRKLFSLYIYLLILQ